MTTVFLIRHGEYRDEPEQPGGPLRDRGLNDAGRAQIEKLRDRIARDPQLAADVLVSSTLPRALETAQILAAAYRLPVVEERDLEEWRSDDGTIPVDQFMAQWRALNERQRPFHRFQPDAETGIEFTTRIHTALHCVISQHADRRLAIVAHGGVIQAAFQFFFGYGDAAFRRAYPAAANGSITAWRREVPPGGHERWVLEFSNDRSHLQ